MIDHIFTFIKMKNNYLTTKKTLHVIDIKWNLIKKLNETNC